MGSDNLFVFLLILNYCCIVLPPSLCLHLSLNGLAEAKQFGGSGADTTWHRIDTERLPYYHPSLPLHCLRYSQRTPIPVTPYLNSLLFFPLPLCCDSSTLSKQQGIIGQRLPTRSGMTISPNTRTLHESCSLSSE